MKIIKHREIVTQTEYSLFFERRECPGSGFSYSCDVNGCLLKKDHEARVEELKNNPYFIDKGIVEYSWDYSEPAIGVCEFCESEVELDRFTNECPGCNADYNMSGQLLSPREQWGEETGESLSDILSIL